MKYIYRYFIIINAMILLVKLVDNFWSAICMQVYLHEQPAFFFFKLPSYFT